MKNIKEILRLASEGGLSARQIARSCNCSPSTVTAVLERARSANLEMDWPLINQMDDEELETKIYQHEHCSSVSTIKPENRWDYTGTASDVISMGYDACKKCHPF